MTPKRLRRLTLFLLVTLSLSLLPPTDAEPQCENPPHPLPALSSCLWLVQQIYHEAKTNPYLYTWSHTPSQFDERLLPAVWIESVSPYTYVCSVRVDLVRGHEAEEDSFTYKDVAKAVSQIVSDCLTPAERGIRPMVGWEMVGYLKRPEVVRVEVGSTMRKGREGEGVLRVGNSTTVSFRDAGNGTGDWRTS
ncbi:MAG: hypothetical protein Q9202_006310 [Teloschistes flavicans]